GLRTHAVAHRACSESNDPRVATHSLPSYEYRIPIDPSSFFVTSGSASVGRFASIDSGTYSVFRLWNLWNGRDNTTAFSSKPFGPQTTIRPRHVLVAAFHTRSYVA